MDILRTENRQLLQVESQEDKDIKEKLIIANEKRF